MRIAICLSIAAWTFSPGLGAAGPPATEHVHNLLSPAAAVRAHAARCLGRLGEKSAGPALAAALKDGEASVRREAAKALGLIRDARAIAELTKALADRDTNVRFYAAYALGEIKSPQSADALIGALRDPQWCVRNQAAWALRELGDAKVARRLAAALEADGADVGQIVWILRRGRRGPAGETVDEVARLLKAPQASTRRRAAVALGSLGGPKAAAALPAALADDSAAVRRAAAEALLAVGDRPAIEALAKLAPREQDAAVRRAAEQAVRRLSRHADLLGHWSFDDGTARDVTGGGSDGKVLGCQAAEGKVGRALRFAKDRYVELGKPAGVPIAQSPLTVMAWAKPEDPNGVVVARGGAFCGFSLYVKGGAARFGIHRMEAGPAYIAAGREKVVGRWVHLAGVVKRDRIELYVNAKLAATTKTPGYIPGNCGQGMEIGFDAGNSPAEITDGFVGIIDEVKVYRAALSADEIAGQCRPAQSKQPRKQ